tara:strand:- start:3065 stop:3523 length:459 start_codon:yes stop_codon:yes gene_type:complete
MFEMLTTVLTGGATGILGTVIGKGFSFIDNWQKEKANDKEHTRTIELYKVQAELKLEEKEKEMEAQMQVAEIGLRSASYGHDQSVGKSSRWAVNVLRMVRPAITGGLIILVGVIYFATDDLAQQETIIQSVIYMASSATLWWFGDRALRSKS